MIARQAALTRRWSNRFRPPPEMTVAEWAEGNLTLTKYTENKGAYSAELTPFVREWLENFRDPSVVECTLVTGSQVAKTTSELAGLAWTVVNRPTEVLWVGDAEKNVKSLSETRWDDIVENCDALRALKPSDPDRYKKLEQQFARCTVHWAGSNSPGTLASKPIGLLIEDETDKYAPASTKEAHAAELAEQRVKSYSSYKIFRSSTPTIAAGYIWQRYLQGDQRRYFVPCPHCGEKIPLEWKQVKWSDAARRDTKWDLAIVAATAHYECQLCHAPIEEKHKTAMLRAGEWRPTNPLAQAGHRSYHLSSLYSPWRLTSFGALAVQFIEAKDSLLGLQGFINGVLAEPWEDQQYVDPISFPEGQYSITEIDVKETALALTADVQLDHFYAVARGHGDGMFSRLHFAERVESFDDLEALQRKFGIARNMAGIDCGYDRNGDVYKFCARHQWYALRGDDPRDGFYRHPLPDGKHMRRIYSVAERIDAFLGTHAGATGYCLRSFFAKDKADDILQQLLLGIRGQWQTPRDVPEIWLKQINARRKLPKRDPLTGDTTLEWTEVVRKFDHLRDCECMQIILAAMRGFLREFEITGAPPAAKTDDRGQKTDYHSAPTSACKPRAPRPRPPRRRNAHLCLDAAAALRGTGEASPLYGHC